MDKAIRYAFRLLRYRQRSESELLKYLKQKNFPAKEITQAVIYLKQENLINDLRFSRDWIESRLSKPLGIKRIRQELLNKGIERKIIQQAFSGIEYSEKQIIQELILKRLQKLKHESSQKVRRKIFLFLQHRGFDSGQILEQIQETIPQEDENRYFKS